MLPSNNSKGDPGKRRNLFFLISREVFDVRRNGHISCIEGVLVCQCKIYAFNTEDYPLGSSYLLILINGRK